MQDVLAFSGMTDGELVEVLQKHKIGLSIAEARHIPELLGRDPTLTEATVWGIQGSEHCSYKSSRRHLRGFPVSAPNVIVPVGEDSGVFSLIEHNGERYGVIVAHESHNHPSQIVPFEGAATGVGGIVRDIACMGGRVIGTMDSLRFGDISRNPSKWIAGGVVSGVGGYGNPIGVPNVGGDVFFHNGYNDNCLVNVVALGTVKESEVIHSYVPDEAADEAYEFVAVGKPTDRSGMGGASFASASFGTGSEEELESKKSAVQEPNPFLKRHILVSTYDLFRELKERGWLKRVAFKDLGAGGNICSTVELVAKKGFGAEVDLEKIHTAYDGLPASVIACSETQERFMWACHPDITDFILKHYNEKWNLPMVCEKARASKIGRVTRGNYVLKFHGEVVCDAKAEHITEGFVYERPFSSVEKKVQDPVFSIPPDLSSVFLKMLSSENIASHKPIYEKYDKQVQGYVVIERGEADASLLVPFLDHEELGEKRYIGLASSVAGNPWYGSLSAKLQGANAVVSAMRAVAAVGAYPQAFTDCLNYGNPEKPEQMAELVDGIAGIKEALENVKLKNHREFATPVVSGNVSLYNEGAGGSIPPSAVLACFGKIDDARKAVTMQLKSVGNILYMIGARKDECGGSEYYRALGLGLGANVPTPDYAAVQSEIYALTDAIAAGCVRAAKTIGEGGILVALAKMCIGGFHDGVIGVEVDVSKIAGTESSANALRSDKALFSETGGFVVEVEPSDSEAFMKALAAYGVTPVEIGRTTDNQTFVLKGDSGFELSLEDVRTAWTQGLREKLA